MIAAMIDQKLTPWRTQPPNEAKNSGRVAGQVHSIMFYHSMHLYVYLTSDLGKKSVISKRKWLSEYKHMHAGSRCQPPVFFITGKGGGNCQKIATSILSS
jgi:hypothetical protein